MQEETLQAVYGVSHVISLAEAKHIYEKGVKRLLIDSGQYGNDTLSSEAADYFERKL